MLTWAREGLCTVPVGNNSTFCPIFHKLKTTLKNSLLVFSFKTGKVTKSCLNSNQMNKYTIYSTGQGPTGDASSLQGNQVAWAPSGPPPGDRPRAPLPPKGPQVSSTCRPGSCWNFRFSFLLGRGWEAAGPKPTGGRAGDRIRREIYRPPYWLPPSSICSHPPQHTPLLLLL